MKPSQQIAEELAKLVIDEWAKGNRPMTEVLPSIVPLVELIEVARAVDAWCNKERFDEFEGQRLIVDMKTTLEELRATGKVEI